MEAHPVAIIPDRYSGAYSGGRWLAIACAMDVLNGGVSRINFCFESGEGPYAPDPEAGRFWLNPPSWIAVGGTPDEALANLRNSQT